MFHYQMCQAVTKWGKRCGRDSGKEELCWQHKVFVPKFALEPRKSTIPKAGRGVFVKSGHIAAGTRVMQYVGKLVPEDHIGNHDYCFAITDAHCIKAWSGKVDETDPNKLSGIVNDSYGTKNKPNLDWVVTGKKVWMVAIRDITAGEELFISYGDKYWETRD